MALVLSSVYGDTFIDSGVYGDNWDKKGCHYFVNENST